MVIKQVGLSKLAYHFMGGFVGSLPTITALAALSVALSIVVNSLTGATWAPATFLVEITIVQRWFIP
jgi:glutamine synthetase